jgi:hypothetical protein
LPTFADQVLARRARNEADRISRKAGSASEDVVRYKIALKKILAVAPPRISAYVDAVLADNERKMEDLDPTNESQEA